MKWCPSCKREISDPGTSEMWKYARFWRDNRCYFCDSSLVTRSVDETSETNPTPVAAATAAPQERPVASDAPPASPARSEQPPVAEVAAAESSHPRETSRTTPAEICWFCSRNTANEGKALQVRTHKVTGQSYSGYTTSTKYVQGPTVSVPRCSVCTVEHRWALAGYLMAIPNLFIVTVLFGLATDSSEGFMVGFGFVLGVVWLLLSRACLSAEGAFLRNFFVALNLVVLGFMAILMALAGPGDQYLSRLVPWGIPVALVLAFGFAWFRAKPLGDLETTPRWRKETYPAVARLIKGGYKLGDNPRHLFSGL